MALCVTFMILLVFTACARIEVANPTSYLYHVRGFNAAQENSLIALDKTKGQIGHIEGDFSFGGAFFFMGSSGSISGSTRPGTTLGFAVSWPDHGKERILMVELPFEKVEFVFADTSYPTVKFHMFGLDTRRVPQPEEEMWIRSHPPVQWEREIFGPKSTAEIILQYTKYATITISRELFEREVMPFIQR